MVQSKITSRLSSIEHIILTQTDTTVGFISQNAQKLYEVKSRQTSKQFIKVFSSITAFTKSKHRVPSTKKNIFRRSKKTTFIFKNTAVRISPSPLHSQILRTTEWNYSTSANESGKKFDINFCQEKADIIIQDRDGLQEKSSSKLLKINNVKTKRLR